MKKVECKQISTSLVILSLVSSVMVSIASINGIFVYRDLALKLTKISSLLSFSLWTSIIQLVESLTNEYVLPTKGFNNVVKNFSNMYVGDTIVLTIGRSGAPFLCIFGRP